MTNASSRVAINSTNARTRARVTATAPMVATGAHMPLVIVPIPTQTRTILPVRMRHKALTLFALTTAQSMIWYVCRTVAGIMNSFMSDARVRNYAQVI